MYSLMSKIIHIVSALLVFALLPIGYIMVDLDYYSQWYQVLPQWHYLLGLVFAGLLVIRIANSLWIDRVNRQSLPSSLIVKLGHLAIYVFMVSCVVTGYTLASDDLFFFPSVYQLIEINQDYLLLAHQISTYGLLVLIMGHIGMALVHQWLFKEALLQRMFHHKKPQ